MKAEYKYYPDFFRVVDFISEREDYYLTSTKNDVIFHFNDGSHYCISKVEFNAAYNYANGIGQEV